MPDLELPSWRAAPEDGQRTLEVIDAWAGSTSLASIVSSFGGVVPTGGNADRLAWLDGFAGAHWDFRRGRERESIGQSGLTSAQTEAVFAGAPVLGLSGRESPSQGRYDTIIMTGGMVRACIVKPRFAAELLEAGLKCDNILFLGGFRTFSREEAGLAAALGMRAEDEFEAMVAGLELAFGPLGTPELVEGSGSMPFLSWRHLSWQLNGLPRLGVLAAPSSDPVHRRADSADTYRFWAGQRMTHAERSVLQVTTPIYVPYQSAVAISILGLDHGAAVETVGVRAEANDLAEFTQQFRAEHCLQELRAAVGAMLSLRRRLVAAGAGSGATAVPDV
ncbi:MAG: hypothetical protein V4531_00305 [Actinomycetota bacterium]